MPYKFDGITPYIERAAEKLGLTCNEQINRAKSGWHLKTIVNALTQLPEQVAKARAGHIDPKTTQDVLDRINLVRKALAVQLQGIDDAIADVTTGLGLTSTDAPADAASNVKQPKKKGDDKA